MYSDCSSKYWKQKRKSNPLKTKVSVTLILILATILLVGNAHRNRKYEEKERLLLENQRNIRPSPTNIQFLTCDTNMRDVIDNECAELCRDEIVSIPRPTMYKSCIHGCSRSIFAAAKIGCRLGSLEEAFKEENRLQAQNSCSRFQNVEPQPYVLSTCRKYYREGTKHGRNLGNEFINNLIDSEWAKARNEG
jgi:hypothetical protein